MGLFRGSRGMSPGSVSNFNSKDVWVVFFGFNSDVTHSDEGSYRYMNPRSYIPAAGSAPEVIAWRFSDWTSRSYDSYAISCFRDCGFSRTALKKYKGTAEEREIINLWNDINQTLRDSLGSEPTASTEVRVTTKEGMNDEVFVIAFKLSARPDRIIMAQRSRY